MHFCMFKKSQMKHNSLDCHKFFEIFFINFKFYMLKFWHKTKKQLHVQRIQTSKVDNPCIFQIIFLSKCVPFPLKIEEDFDIDD
jgi:hypothetical protein